MTELSQGSCFLASYINNLHCSKKGQRTQDFFQATSSEQQDHHSAEFVFVMPFHWLGIFISVKILLIILCTKWFPLRVTTCNGCSARRLWSFFDLNLGKSWHVIHSYVFFIPAWQCWAFSAVQYKLPKMQNASTCHLQMRIKVISFLGACLSAVRDPLQFRKGKCIKIKTDSWLKPCLKSSCVKWNEWVNRRSISEAGLPQVLFDCFTSCPLLHMATTVPETVR